MAKGSLNGILTGKLGNTIMYKVTNSANKEKQGMRQYVASIANPQTTPQATQRLRMKPAINFYRGLADLLDHSWEGVKYGALSRQKFMQLALRSDADFAIPFVTKGESRFIPGEYPVSLGSVPMDTQLVVSDTGSSVDDFSVSWGVLVSSYQADFTTWGEVSQNFIDNSNGMLRDGDEITIILVRRLNNQFIPFHSYVVLDTSSTLAKDVVWAAAGFVLDDSGIIQIVESQLNEDNELVVVQFSSENPCVAAAVIVSRHPSRTSTTWLRTSSYMACGPAFRSEFMSNAALQNAIASYQTQAADLTSDWLLNQAGGDVATGGSSGSSVVRTTVNYVSVTITPTSGSVQYRMGAVLTNSENPSGRTILSSLTGSNRKMYSISGTTLVPLTNAIPDGASVSPAAISIDDALNLLSGYSVGADPDEPIVEPVGD